MKMQVDDDETTLHRHYMDRRSLSRAMRLFLLGKPNSHIPALYSLTPVEREMRDLDQDWVFKSYSARDDEAYKEFMIEVDELRIKNGYQHECGQYCQAQGCMYKAHSKVYSLDGMNFRIS